MIFTVDNLGPIEHAELELGKMTVVCGKNNSGKTYLTYTLATFLLTIKRNLRLPVQDSLIDQLMGRGEVRLDLMTYVNQYIEAVQDILPRFRQSLPRFLAMHPDRFVNTNIDVNITREEIVERLSLPQNGANESIIKVTNGASIRFARMSSSMEVIVSLTNNAEVMPSREIIVDAMQFMMARMFDDAPLVPVFPDVFVITCERTGAMLFRNELIKIRERVYEDQMLRHGQELRNEFFRGYQRPVSDELNFILELPRVQSRKSMIVDKNPEIIELLSLISGGTYGVDSESKQVRFSPLGNLGLTLSLQESSSTVRSLAEFYFYVMHKARPGQLLIFDEPELNLHPENQRLLARLLAMLANSGIRVFITTHSDYILRELNALVRLNKLPENVRNDTLEKYAINTKSLIGEKDTYVYVLRGGFVEQIMFNSVYQAFAVPSFDNTIDKYNQLYNDIRYLDFHDMGERRV